MGSVQLILPAWLSIESHVDTAVRVLTDNYPAVKVLIKILVLSPFFVSQCLSLWLLSPFLSCLFFFPFGHHFLFHLFLSFCLFSSHVSSSALLWALVFCLPLHCPFLDVCLFLSPSVFLSAHLFCPFFLMSFSLCLIQTSRRSSYRCEWSTIREQHHALERCYFWACGNTIWRWNI